MLPNTTTASEKDSTTSPAAYFPDAPQNLSQAINTSTKDLHDTVNFAIMDRFQLLLSSNNHELYLTGMTSFHPVYSTFERVWSALLSSSSTLRPNISTAITAIHDPRLFRSSAIAADLSYLSGGSFDPDASPSRPQVVAYVNHIENAIREKPHVVLAYAHSYYMALFAGGKVLRKLLVNKKGFFPVHLPAGDEEEARRFSTGLFVFPADDPEEIRNKFKAGMVIAEEGLSEEEKTDIINEARAIFKWNEKLIHELDSICAPMYVKGEAAQVGKSVMAFAKKVQSRCPVDGYKLPAAVMLLCFLWLIKRAFLA
ncbi:heme oxygenase-like protein [Ascodesmis nigricans]|uniref:Heme oxygenase-like protein n=1 Tax=Ascodesmis nigricans TaxID=341454 RepID=A0A4S2N1B6_9PEZI|nr:heme oxygenase-like protein [Ascodesmis nigricans]